MGETRKWPKFSHEKLNYFILNSDIADTSAKTITGLKYEFCYFWNEVMAKI